VQLPHLAAAGLPAKEHTAAAGHFSSSLCPQLSMPVKHDLLTVLHSSNTGNMAPQHLFAFVMCSLVCEAAFAEGAVTLTCAMSCYAVLCCVVLPQFLACNASSAAGPAYHSSSNHRLGGILPGVQ
jgi:hypothetical protein